MQNLRQLEKFRGTTMRKTGKSAKHGVKRRVSAVCVTGGPSSRLPHVIFRCRDTDLFVFLRLP
jgi:hypothetical protein